MGGSERKILSVYGRVLSNDNALFWCLQLFGWTGISLLTYLSLSVPYDQYELAYLAHNIFPVCGGARCLDSTASDVSSRVELGRSSQE